MYWVYLLPYHLDPVSQVSWLRSGALEVLSVGDKMFSSDTRLSVVKDGAQGDSLEVWSLRITNITSYDQGVYKCQVRKMSKNVITQPHWTVSYAGEHGAQCEQNHQSSYQRWEYCSRE